MIVANCNIPSAINPQSCLMESAEPGEWMHLLVRDGKTEGRAVVCETKECSEARQQDKIFC